MNRALPLLACVLLTPLSAKVTLAPLFCDGAVLQRGKPVPVWGTADAGEKITATFAGQQVSATAGPDGRWKVAFNPLTASAESRDLVVKGSDTVTVRDVVVGEVWLASGQSNMEWPLASCSNAKTEIAAANFPRVRQFKVAKTASFTPLASVEGSWVSALPPTAGRFSGVAYYFALALHGRLDVPIGILNSSWGGSGIDPWISPDAYRTTPELSAAFTAHEKGPRPTSEEKAAYETRLDAWAKDRDAAKAAGQPFKTEQPKTPKGFASYRTLTALNNGMIAPLAPYALRGAIWYQGESNTSQASGYALRLTALVTGWRAQFAQPDLAVYWVQLPNLDHGGLNATTWHWAELREAQTKALALPNTGQAVTIDVGEAKNLHPKNKKPVGERLALLALARTYAVKGVIDSGPVFASAKREGHAYRIFFEPSPSGLESTEPSVTGFELAGADKNFLPAEARIDGSTVVVTCAGVAEPVAVRYCYRNAPTPGLFNAAGLPAAPFRTDTWPAPKQTKAPTPLPES